MILSLFFTIWLIYAVMILRFVRKQLGPGLDYIRKEDQEFANKYDCFRRKDIHKWNHFEMYFCAVFLLPIRVVYFFASASLLLLFVRLGQAVIPDSPKFAVLKRKTLKNIARFFSRSGLYGCGFFSVVYKSLKISDLDETYPVSQEQKQLSAPIVISNHVSWADICLYMSCPESPSFLAKQAVARYPIFGPTAKALGAIFVKRESRDNKEGVMTQIKERIDLYKKDPHSTPQLIIFPEGTTSNGEYLISFKKGAFMHLTPLKIYAVKYTNPNYSPAFDSLGIGKSFLFALLQLRNSITVYDLGVFDPTYLNLKSEDDWTIYAEKVKSIMLKALGAKSSELGLAEANFYCDSLDGQQTPPQSAKNE